MMTEHDRIRMERAKNCDPTNRDSLIGALVGLQSTDDPSLCKLHDELMKKLVDLEDGKKKK